MGHKYMCVRMGEQPAGGQCSQVLQSILYSGRRRGLSAPSYFSVANSKVFIGFISESGSMNRTLMGTAPFPACR